MNNSLNVRESRPGGMMTSFALHIIAMAAMLCDHMWATVLPGQEWLGYIGRIAFPIFAFLLVEGFHYTSSRKRYALNMLVFALVTEIPFNLMAGRNVFYPLHQNVLFAYLLGFLMMCADEKIKLKKHMAVRVVLYAAVTLVFYLLGLLSFVDYYGYGILMIALFYFTRRKETDTLPVDILRMVIQTAAMFYINSEMIKGLVVSFTVFGHDFEMHKQTFALLALPLLWLYKGRQGPYNKVIKYIYYLFYPVHMLVLGLILTLA